MDKVLALAKKSWSLITQTLPQFFLDSIVSSGLLNQSTAHGTRVQAKVDNTVDKGLPNLLYLYLIIAIVLQHSGWPVAQGSCPKLSSVLLSIGKEESGRRRAAELFCQSGQIREPN